MSEQREQGENEIHNHTEAGRINSDPDQQPKTPDLNRGKGNIFSRVKEKVAEMAGSAKVRAKMAGPERFAEAYNQFKFRDHEHRVNYLQDERRIFATRIEDLQSKIEKIDQSAESVIANIGDLPTDIRQKFEAEKELLKKALEKNKGMLSDVEQQLSVQNEKTGEYDKKLKDIAKNLRESIDKVLAGPEERLQYLRDLGLQAGREALNFENKIGEIETALDHMPVVWDNAASKTEQDIYADQIKELRQLLKYYKKQLSERANTIKRTGDKSDALDKRLGYLRGKRDKYAAIEQNGIVPEAVLNEKKAENEKIREIENFLSKSRYPLDRVIAGWNKLYKSKLDLSGEDFNALFNERNRLNKLFYGEKSQREGIDYYTFMSLVSVYAKWKKINLDFDTQKFIFEMQKLPRLKESRGHEHGHGSEHGGHGEKSHGHEGEEQMAERMRYNKYSLDALIAGWNKLHRAEMMILPNEFKNAITEQGRLEIKDKGIDIYYFADLVRQYAKKKKVKLHLDINEFAKAVKDFSEFDKSGEVHEHANAAVEENAEVNPGGTDVPNVETDDVEPTEHPENVSVSTLREPKLNISEMPDAQSTDIADYESPLIGNSATEFDEDNEARAVEVRALESGKNNKYERTINEFVRVWNKYFSGELKIDQAEFQSQALEMFEAKRFKTISISQMLEVMQKFFLKKEFGDNADEIVSGRGHRKDFIFALKKLSKFFSDNKKGFAHLEKSLKGKSFKEATQLRVEQEQLYGRKSNLAYLCDKWNEGSDFKLIIADLTRSGQPLSGMDAKADVEIGAFLDAAEEYVSKKVSVPSGQVNLTYIFGKLNFEQIINYDIRHNRAAARS